MSFIDAPGYFAFWGALQHNAPKPSFPEIKRYRFSINAAVQ